MTNAGPRAVNSWGIVLMFCLWFAQTTMIPMGPILRAFTQMTSKRVRWIKQCKVSPCPYVGVFSAVQSVPIQAGALYILYFRVIACSIPQCMISDV